MKSPMNMAPNKMVSPAKSQLGDLDKDGKMSSYENARQNAIEKNKKKSVLNMNSPMKMGSAYKMDKSAFKLKSAPVNMNTPGSVAKLAGVSPMKNDLRKDLKEKGFKRTGESEVTRTLTDEEVKAYKAKKK